MKRPTEAELRIRRQANILKGVGTQLNTNYIECVSIVKTALFFSCALFYSNYNSIIIKDIILRRLSQLLIANC